MTPNITSIATFIITVGVLSLLMANVDGNGPIKRARGFVRLPGFGTRPKVQIGSQPSKTPLTSVANVNATGEMTNQRNERTSAFLRQTESSLFVNDKAFSLLKKLGSGTYGEVWKAKCNKTKELFAIKMVPFSTDEDEKKHLESEMRIQQALEHKLIVRLYKTFDDTAKRMHYMQTELVEGGELYDLMFTVSVANEFGYYERVKMSNGDSIITYGKFLEDHTRFYAAEILLALEFLHGKDIVHRDIKPDNILLTGGVHGGHIKIADFGFATEIKDDGQKFDICGTLSYIPPELLNKKGVNKSADLWALGVILYNMLTGSHPFQDTTIEKESARIRENKLVYHRKHFTEHAEDLIRNLLNSDPEKRFTVAQAKNHEFFTNHPGWDWNKVTKLEVKPAFRPKESTYSFYDEKDKQEKSIKRI